VANPGSCYDNFFDDVFNDKRNERGVVAAETIRLRAMEIKKRAGNPEDTWSYSFVVAGDDFLRIYPRLVKNETYERHSGLSTARAHNISCFCFS